MARNNPEVQNRGGARNSNTNSNNRTTKYYGTSPKYFKSITPPMSGGKYNGGGEHHSSTSPRLSPARVTTPPSSLGTSPRTSPGLLAGHYAGCKFTEPPLPSALPLPPQHWMQQPHHAGAMLRSALPAFGTNIGVIHEQPDQLAHQLKVLLNVQA